LSSFRRNQIALVAAAFVGFTGFTLVMPFLALYMRELGLTETGEIALWTGVTLGVTPAVTAFCAPLWGRVGDRFGNKLLVQRSLASCVVVMALMAFASRPWHLFALRAIQGFVAGYGPLTLAMAAVSAPRERLSRAIGAVQTAQRVAPAIGPVIGGVLAAAVGLRNAFLVSAGVYAVAFLLMAWLYIEPARRGHRGDGAERLTFSSILAFENFLLLMLVIFGLQLVDRSFGPVLLLHLDQIGYSSERAALTVGVLFSVLALSGAFGNQLAAVVLKRASARVVIAGAALLAALALGLFALGEAPWLLIATIAVFGAAVGTAMTTAYTAAGSVIPRHAHGASFGFLSGASLIGSAVSPVISGRVAGNSIQVVFFSGVVALAALALVVRRVMVERNLEIEPAPTEEP
jgi:DHA1 family multidrug resistance protein-like MFS transporter